MSIVMLYESEAMRAVSGPVIRPGGFELTDRGLARCHLSVGARVLDIGCGAGASVDYLRRRHGFSAMGLDLCAALLQEGLRTYGEMVLVRGRAEQLPVAGGSFCAVLGECVLSLCPDPQLVLKEVWRVLQPGGHLVLTDVYARVPAETARADDLSVQSCLQGAVDRTTTEGRLAAAGFKSLLWEDHTPLLKRLAAQLVWTYGSLDAFWRAAGGAHAAEEMKRGANGGCRHPGYFLLVVRKPECK